MLGVHLAGERGMTLGPPVLAALGLRLLVAPLVLLGLSAIIVDVPGTYVFQAAMPSGINSLVVAHACGLDLRLTASAVAISTALVVLVGTSAAVLG